MICASCGQETNNRKSKRYGNCILCDNCRAAVEAARSSQAEWEAQTGNPAFQQGDASL